MRKAKSFSEGFQAKRRKSSVKNIVFPKIRAEMSTQAKILYLVKSRKATRLTDIAEILGKTKSTVSEHLYNLSKSGKIHMHVKGKEKICYFGKLKSSKKRKFRKGRC